MKNAFARRMLLVLAIALPLVTPGFAAQAAEAERSALNRAGEQRMLSQRIVKAYGQMALATMTRQAAEQLRDSVRRFEENTAALGGGSAPSAAALKAGEELSRTWTPFRAKVFEPPTPESAWLLARMSDDVLAAAERLVSAWEPSPSVASAVNIAGRQRMLSQRVAKAYVLMALGLDTAQVREELGSASRSFDAGLEALAQRRDNTPDIRRELDELRLQWEWLRNAIAVDGAVSYRLIVAEASEAILDIAERLTVLYERAGAGGVARLPKDPS